MSKCGQPIFGENTLHTNEVCCCLSAQAISMQPKWAAAFLANFWTHTAASRLDRHRVGISRFENKSFLQKNEQQKVDPFWKAMEHVSCWQLLQHGSITEWWGGPLWVNLSGLFLHIFDTPEYCDVIKMLSHARVTWSLNLICNSTLMTSQYSGVSKMYRNLPSTRYS